MTTSPSDLTGLFKEAYGDDVINLIPEEAKFIKKVPFVAREKETGNLYHQPVIVAQEHGFTYASPTDGAFALNAAVSMTMQDAQIQGSQMLLRSSLSYDAAARASNSKKAFVKATELLVENMIESMTKRLEIACLYGGSGTTGGLGIAASSSNQSTTTTLITFTAASWAAGIWSGLENAPIQFYYGASTLVSSGADSIFTVTAVNTNNLTVLVTGTTTGISALDTAISGQTVRVYFNTAYNKEMVGMRTILVNTGTLFNIAAGTYNLWTGNTYSASSGQLTMGKVLSAIALSVDRGLNEEVDVWVNPKTWANLNSDLAALRMYDSSYSDTKVDNGSQEICYYGMNGKINIIGYNLIKAGEAMWFPSKRVQRIGAQDMSFKTPGRDDEIFLQMPSNAGFELRNYCDEAVLFTTPPRGGVITGIVNS